MRTIALILLIASTVSFVQSAKPVTDYLGVPGPILFQNKIYDLNWSAHPADNYYKQEYLVKGDPENNYSTMILIEAITNPANIKDIVSGKIAALKKLKAQNPIVNYEVFDNAGIGEYMIDFLLSQNTADGKVAIVERNIYRYKVFTDKSGHKVVLLFGISTRSYGNDIDNFLLALKSNRKILNNTVAKFTMPEITIKN